MICGNYPAQEILKTYFERIKKSENIGFNFVLLNGPENIGKTTLVRQFAKEYLGVYHQTDFLYIPDLTTYLGKKHTIKISVDAKDQNVHIDGAGDFKDLGTREIVNWVYKYPVGDYKILLLENIERMTISAANALLKTFEEPMDNVLIFATCGNKQNVLNTILSRAFILNFELPNHDEVLKCLKDSYPDVDSKKLDLIISFSMNRIGFAKKLIGKDHSSEMFGDLVDMFERYLSLDAKGGNYHEKISLLNDVNKTGFLNMFLDSLIFYYSKNNKFDKIDGVIETKKYIGANVGVENALFNMCLS